MNLFPSVAMKLGAGVALVQALLLAYHLYGAGVAAKINEDRLDYLYDFIRRNEDKIDEFDKIALRELGLIKADA